MPVPFPRNRGLDCHLHAIFSTRAKHHWSTAPQIIPQSKPEAMDVQIIQTETMRCLGRALCYQPKQLHVPYWPGGHAAIAVHRKKSERGEKVGHVSVPVEVRERARARMCVRISMLHTCVCWGVCVCMREGEETKRASDRETERKAGGQAGSTPSTRTERGKEREEETQTEKID